MALGTLRMLCDYVQNKRTFLPRCFISKHFFFTFGAFSSTPYRIKMAKTKPNVYVCCVRSEGDYIFQMMVSVFGFTHAETEHKFFFFGWHFPREISDCFYANKPFSLRDTYVSPIYSARFRIMCTMYMLVAIVICSIFCSRFVPRAYDVFIYQRIHKIRHWTIVAFDKPQIST